MSQMLRLLLFALWKLSQNQLSGSLGFILSLSIIISLQLLIIEMTAKDWQLFRTFIDELLNFLYARCRIGVNRLRRKLPRQLSEEDWQDVLQTAYVLCSRPEVFLQNFDGMRSTHGYIDYTLIHFVDRRLKGILFEELRKITGQPTIGRTNLGLMAQASPTRVRRALQDSGYSESIFAQYFLTWQCFKEVQKTQTLSINKYQTEQYQAIADRYNHHNLYPKADAGQIRQWLDKIGSVIRQLIDPEVSSLEPLIDIAADRTTISDEVEFTEFRRHLKSLLEQLRTRDQKLFLLRHGLHMNQSEIAQEFNLTPSAIGHHLSTLYQTSILPDVVNWTNQRNNINEPSLPDLSEILKQLKGVLDHYYEDQLNLFVQDFQRNDCGAYEYGLKYRIFREFQQHFSIDISHQVTQNRLLRFF